MILDYILLAEAAASGEGKQFLHGAGLRRIDAPQIPFLAQVAIAMRFTAGVEEAGDEHVVRFRVTRPSGDELLETPPLEIQVSGDVGADAEEIGVHLMVEGTFNFPEVGWYVFHVTLDDEPLGEPLRLRIVLIDRPSEGAVDAPDGNG